MSLYTLGEIGIGNSAHVLRKAYIGGSDGKAHKIKRAYIGDANGKAKLFFEAPARVAVFKSGGSGTTRKTFTGAARAGNYAIYAGGANVTVNSSTNTPIGDNTNLIEAFSKDLVKTIVSNSSSTVFTGTTMGASVTIGNTAFFNGGWMKYGWGSGTNENTYSVNSSLTINKSMSGAGWAANQLTTKVGTYGLFGGGDWKTGMWSSGTSSAVAAYSEDGTKVTPASLDRDCSAGSVALWTNNRGLFVYNYWSNSNACAYDASLTKTTLNAGAIEKLNANFSSASSDYIAVLHHKTENKFYIINQSLTVSSVTNSGDTFSGYSQAVYSKKPLETAMNGFFLFYATDYSTPYPEYIMVDAKAGTILEQNWSGATETQNQNQGTWGVSFDDTALMYNAWVGTPYKLDYKD